MIEYDNNNRIIQLEEICLSLEECEKLNNTIPSALAWVWNPYKNTPEFELTPLEKAVSGSHESVMGIRFTKGKWEMWNADVFVSYEQVRVLISKGHFFFAPLKQQ